MGIYKRARHLAVVAACATGMVAGVGAIAAPGEALATVTCGTLNGSGSSLQGEQQSAWTKLTNAKTIGSCSKVFTAKYTSTSSGKGLEEFALQENSSTHKFQITPERGTNEKLDGFIGTDDPPIATALTESKTASGSFVDVAPVVAAPIAIIIHLPTVVAGSCEYTPGSSFSLTPTQLEEFWATNKTWGELFNALGIAHTGCTEDILLEVRSDSSGTSFAFKQYLSQVSSATWGSLVNDGVNWPAGTTVHTTHNGGEANEGSGGEAKAVSTEAGSIGYVNLANAHTVGFGSYVKGGSSTFWAEINGVEPANGEKGNCPSEIKGSGPKKETAGWNWSEVHLGNTSETVDYSLCTLTYDVAWETYTGSGIVADYGGSTAAGEIGNSANAYLVWATKETEGQENIAPYYSPLPTGGSFSPLKEAEKIAKTVG